MTKFAKLLSLVLALTMLCGVAFAVARDRILGRGVWVRLFGGKLENRMPLAVFSLIKGLCPKMKNLPLIPSIAASIVVGGAFGLAGSLLYSRAFNMLTLEGAMATASIFVLVTGILQGAAAGFFAVSWVEYIRTDAPSGENGQGAESGKTTEFSYLDEYKKNIKENGRNV